MDNEIFFLVLPKYNSTQVQQLQFWYSKCNAKEICLSAQNGRANPKLKLKSYCSKFILTPVFICLQSSSYFNMEKKAMKANIRLISSTCFCYYRKHPNNDNKICPLPSSSCFQQHFHDWFNVLRHNSDLPKLEWSLLLFNFNWFDK